MVLGSLKTILKEISSGSFNFEKIFTVLATLKQLKQHYKVRYGQCYPKNASQWAPNSDFFMKIDLRMASNGIGESENYFKRDFKWFFSFCKNVFIFGNIEATKTRL